MKVPFKGQIQSAALFALTSLLLACQVGPSLNSLNRPSSSGLQASTVQANAQSSSQRATSWKNFIQKDFDRTFDEHDLNHNGRIEASEIPYAPKSFTALDKDRNGFLSRQEALPDSRHVQYVTDYMVNHFESKPQAQIPRSEDPLLQQLPGPAELEHFREEVTRPILKQELRQQPHQVPVLLVPGYAEPSWYFMYGIYEQLKAAGWAVEGINLFPNFASAEEQAAKIRERVNEMKRRLGVDRVDLVVHSFGGLVSRYYIQELGGTDHVRNLVTIATPHHGTYVAYLGPGDSALQMRPKSDFLQRLNGKGFAYSPVKYTSIWSNLDEIVIPPKNAIMPDSNVRYVPWTGHLTIMFSQRTYRFIREALEQ